MDYYPNVVSVSFQNLEDFFHAIVLNLSSKRNANIGEIAQLINASCSRCGFNYDILGFMTAAQLKRIPSNSCHKCNASMLKIVFLDITTDEKRILFEDERFTSRIENIAELQNSIAKSKQEACLIPINGLLKTTYEKRKQGYCLNDIVKESVEKSTLPEFIDRELKYFKGVFEMAYQKRPFQDGEFLVALYPASFFMTNKYLYLRKSSFLSDDQKSFNHLIDLSTIELCRYEGKFFKNLIVKFKSGEEQNFRVGFTQVLPEIEFIGQAQKWYEC